MTKKIYIIENGKGLYESFCNRYFYSLPAKDVGPTHTVTVDDMEMNFVLHSSEGSTPTDGDAYVTLYKYNHDEPVYPLHWLLDRPLIFIGAAPRLFTNPHKNLTILMAFSSDLLQYLAKQLNVDDKASHKKYTELLATTKASMYENRDTLRRDLESSLIQYIRNLTPDHYKILVQRRMLVTLVVDCGTRHNLPEIYKAICAHILKETGFTTGTTESGNFYIVP